jgi:Histidine kinase-, DNA gyrase B-, and HSP90-like ATPase
MVNVLVRNTIETYPPEWRLIHEPLQNAIDSFLDSRGRPIPMGGRTPQVEVRLNLGSNTAVISDNGKGIPTSGFTNFLILGNGTKSGATVADHKHLLKGSQGVGIKSTVFTSEIFRVRTTSENKHWEMDLPSYANYSDPEFSGEVLEPEATATEEPSGTEVTVRLRDYTVAAFVRDRITQFFDDASLDYRSANALGQIPLEENRTTGPWDPMEILGRYFRRDSYAGCVSRSLGVGGLPEIRFKLKVCCDFLPEEQEKYNVPGTSAWVTGTAPESISRVAYIDYQELISKLPPRERPRIATDYQAIMEAGRKFDRPTVFHRTLGREDIERLLGHLRKRRTTDPASASLNILEPDEVAIDRNRTALERVNGAILFVASRRFQRTKLAHASSIALSVNGLPTDILLEFTGSELGYVPSVHFILDVDETLGYGKRNLPPRSKGVYNALGRDLWQNLHKLAGYLVAEDDEFDWTAAGTRFDRAMEFGKVLPDTDPRRAIAEDLMGRVTLPETEEDVVAAYFHMAGRGLVPPYRFVRLNDRTIYDGLTAAPKPPNSFQDGNLLTIEFKRSTSDLCRADESRRQRFEDIQLAIVWEASADEDLPIEYASVTREADISYPNYYSGANYRLKKNRNTVQVLALKDIFEAAVAARSAG